MLLNKYDLMWFDFQIEQRVATLKANFFVGVNLGFNVFKMGFLCLIGIAHLPEGMAKLRFYKNFSIRPSISTDLSKSIEEELMNDIPKNTGVICLNLFAAIKKVTNKIIATIPVSGNVKY